MAHVSPVFATFAVTLLIKVYNHKAMAPEQVTDTSEFGVEHLEQISGARMSAIGVGPGRDQTIVRHELAG